MSDSEGPAKRSEASGDAMDGLRPPPPPIVHVRRKALKRDSGHGVLL